MIKLLERARIITFIVTFGTTIPLFIKYLKGLHAGKFIMIHIHVWGGLLFFIFAIAGMIIQFRKKKQQRRQ